MLAQKIAAGGGGASLSMSVLATAAAQTITGSAVGDFAIFANGATASQRKSGGGSTISNLSAVGTGSIIGFDPGARTVNHTGGTPTASGSTTAIAYNDVNDGGANTQNNGTQLTLPATTTLRQAKIYVGIYEGQLRITASLSDGSATSQINTGTILASTGTDAYGVVTIDYAAASAGQTLLVQLVNVTNAGVASNASIQAASWT